VHTGGALVVGGAVLAVGITGAALLRGSASAPLALLAGVAFAALVVATLRVPHVVCSATVVFLMVQPTLRTFVSEAFGPAKDGLVVAICTAAAIAFVFGPLASRARSTHGSWVVSSRSSGCTSSTPRACTTARGSTARGS
jgi:hypothetical protein